MPTSAIDSGSVSIAVTGSGGAGVITTGNMLLNAAARAGWYGLLTRSVGPQIRGGEAASILRLSTDPVECGGETVDILLAVDWMNIERFAAELPLSPDSLVIADPDAGSTPAFIVDSGASVVGLPLKDLAGGIKGGRINMVALGVVAKLVGLSRDALDPVIESGLAAKGADAISASTESVRTGFSFAESLDTGPGLPPAPENSPGRWIISGNQAAGLGAVRGGIRFAAAYPITPATEILEWLSGALRKIDGTLIQAEDELASINMAIGASYGGTPAMTATSGPGLALMTEAIGLASAAEIPVVVIDVMRAGPSTGIPTKSEQGDLNLAVYGLHGDAPHVVVAPLSVADCLFATQWAVHLAESLQLPAIVLSDQFLGQAHMVIDPPANIAFATRRKTLPSIDSTERYQRYSVTPSGVSPMAVPGTPRGQYTADGLEHNQFGTPSSQAEDHSAQSDKRQAKLDNFEFGDHWAEIEGDGDLAIITWGSSTGPARDAVMRAQKMEISVRLIGLRMILPAQPEKMSAALKGVRRVLVVDQSHSGQLYLYLRAHYDLPGDVCDLHRPGPLRITATEILNQIEEWDQ